MSAAAMKERRARRVAAELHGAVQGARVRLKRCEEEATRRHAEEWRVKASAAVLAKHVRALEDAKKVLQDMEEQQCSEAERLNEALSTWEKQRMAIEARQQAYLALHVELHMPSSAAALDASMLDLMQNGLDSACRGYEEQIAWLENSVELERRWNKEVANRHTRCTYLYKEMHDLKTEAEDAVIYRQPCHWQASQRRLQRTPSSCALLPASSPLGSASSVSTPQQHRRPPQELQKLLFKALERAAWPRDVKVLCIGRGRDRGWLFKFGNELACLALGPQESLLVMPKSATNGAAAAASAAAAAAAEPRPLEEFLAEISRPLRQAPLGLCSSFVNMLDWEPANLHPNGRIFVSEGRAGSPDAAACNGRPASGRAASPLQQRSLSPPQLLGRSAASGSGAAPGFQPTPAVRSPRGGIWQGGALPVRIAVANGAGIQPWYQRNGVVTSLPAPSMKAV